MKEYGSDFHDLRDELKEGSSVIPFSLKSANFYANGRQALQALILKNTYWKRIWMPEYFCYDIISSIELTGIEILFYTDTPLTNDSKVIEDLDFKEGDVLFRMNYFGLRQFRSNKSISIPIIEDHSHDLIGDWAMNSDADWCIASLRKTIPIPEGGVLWSPKEHKLPDKPSLTKTNIQLERNRFEAMTLKTEYLKGVLDSKNVVRKFFVETETNFSGLESSSIGPISIDMFISYDWNNWYSKKKENWMKLLSLEQREFEVLVPENEKCNPFSLVIKFKSQLIRDNIKNELINSNIYPAILWPINRLKSKSWETSNKLLSIHCDARYSLYIDELKQKLEKILERIKYV